MKRSQLPLIELRQATFRLGEQLVFKQVDWFLQKGQHWIVTGPTGAGKTVFCRALLGELLLVGGEYRLRLATRAGRAPEESIEYLTATQWAYDRVEGAPSRWFSLDCEQSPLVADLLSWRAIENINPFEVVARSPEQIARWNRRADRVVQQLDIPFLLERPWLALSDGERRKVALAQVLMRAPRLLILDDPFAGLDAAYRRHVRDLLDDLIRRRTVPLILVSSHSDNWPRGMTHLVHIERLRIAGQGPLNQMKRDPAVARFLHGRQQHVAPPRVGRATPKMNRPGPELVAFQDVRIQWNDTVLLDAVNWTVHAGESWAILGPNGSGKSTLLSYILGDNPRAYASHVRVFGRRRGSGESVWDIKRHMGWISPEFHQAFDASLTGLETVLTGLTDSFALSSVPTARQREQARRELRKMGLLHLAERPFGQLSTGQQRLLLLARALIKAPRLLILDEPCQGLDPASRRAFCAEVDRRIRQGATVLYVTHRPSEIPSSIEHSLQLRAGQAKIVHRKKSS